MKQDNDNQWLDPMLEKHIHRETEQFDFAKWVEKHPDEARLLRCGYEDSGRSEKIKPYKIWRFIMESKITKYSAAAVIVLALTLVLFGPFWTPGNSGVVLAEVQQNVAGIDTMIIRGTKTFTRPGKSESVLEFGGMKWEFDLVKYFSQQYGLVEEGYIGNKLIYRFTFNRPKRQTLLILPLYKKYGKFASTDQIMRLLENGTPKGIINLLMEGDYKELGRDNINGVETEVFEFHDPGTFNELLPKAIADIRDIKGKVWIAIKEQLPICVEGDMAVGKSFMTMFQELNLHEVNTLEDFNIEIDENIFDIAPPEGYTELTLSDILKVVPAEAKARAAAMGIIPAGFVLWRRQRKKTKANWHK